MVVIGLKHGRDVVMAGQGGVKPVMNSANGLALDVNINLTHIPYSKYFGMVLGCVTEGQER